MITANQKAMKAIRRKLTRAISLAVTACGYEERIRNAIDARFELESLIEREITQAYEDGRNGQ